MRDEPDVDPVLQLLVQINNDLVDECGISLLVGGTWITGMLVSARTFMTEVAAYIERQAGESGAGMTTFFNVIGQQIYPADAEIEAGVAAPAADAWQWHLHLRGARSVSGSGSRVPEEGCYMRVRMTSVDGWVLASFVAPGEHSAEAPDLGT